MPSGLSGAHLAVWIIAFVATAGVIVRPWKLPEFIWAIAGALLLVASGLLPAAGALKAIGRGMDVYLFLTGMMLLSEVARRGTVFDWLASIAVRQSRGSGRRLFVLVYAIGIVVTVFLSNDATAVVLTPAVLAAARAAKAQPMPHLLACAFIANAASFVLPISNPANLVLYGHHLPPLLQWLGTFLLPSVLAIAATFVVMLLLERRRLSVPIISDIAQPRLPLGGVVALVGIVVTAVVLVAASALDAPLGLPTCLAGIATATLVLLTKWEAPWATLRGVSWTVLPLVAGLFVLVEGLDRTGLLGTLTQALHRASQDNAGLTAWASGIGTGLICNVMNNLPAGLIAGQSGVQGHLPLPVVNAMLIGVDLGPNLSITGSLATILWLTALRREGLGVSFGQFLARGALVMPPALLLALAGLLLTR
ncbi:MAG: arsenic transporter [Janthinobacterium lividum]